MANDYKVVREERKKSEPENKSKIVIEGVDTPKNFGQRNTPPNYTSPDVEDRRDSLFEKGLGWTQHKLNPMEKAKDVKE